MQRKHLPRSKARHHRAYAHGTVREIIKTNFENGGDIQTTGKPVDCRSLTSPPPLDSSKLYIMNEFSQ